MTGFHKRKLERKEFAIKKAEEQARKEKLEERQRVRQERKENLAKELEKFNQAMKEIGREDSEDESDIDWSNGKSKKSDEEGDEYSDWDGLDDDESPKPILKRRQSFQDEDGAETTVVIEEMNGAVDDLYVDMTKNRKVLKESMERAKRSAIVSGAVTKKPRKKFRYLSKDERKMHRTKEHAAHQRKREH